MAQFAMTDPYYAQKAPLAPLSSLSAFQRANRLKGMQDFDAYTAVNPGAALGGSGATGIGPEDERAWELLQARQRQTLADEDEAGGKAAPTVRFGGYDSDPGFMDDGAGATDPLAGLRRAAAARQPVAAVASVPRVSAGGGSDPGSLSALMAGDLLAQGRNPDQIAYQLKQAGYLKPDDVSSAEDQATIEKNRRAGRLPYEEASENADADERTARAGFDTRDEDVIRQAQLFQNPDVQREFNANTLAKMSIAAAGRTPSASAAAAAQRNDPKYVDMIERAAQSVLQGHMSPSQAATLFGGMGANASQTKKDIADRVLQLQPDFDIEGSEANFIQGKKANQPARLIQNIPNTLDVYQHAMEDLPQLMKTPIPAVNSVTQFLGKWLGLGADKEQAAEQASTELSSELGQIMAGGGTGSQTSDFKLRTAMGRLGMSQPYYNQIPSIQAMREILGQRGQAITEGTFAEQNPTQPGQTDTKMKFPNGKTYVVHPADIAKARAAGAVVVQR